MSCLSHSLVRNFRRTATVTALLAALAGPLAIGAARDAAAFDTVSGIRVNNAEERLLQLVNLARTRRGIPALRLTPGYTDVARRWSAVMATRATMAHNPNLVAHVTRAGGAEWRSVAENVAYGYSADRVFDSYMASAPHRANILSGANRYVGMGWAERPGGRGYNTMVFVSTYSSTYGRSRVPAYGGRADARTITGSGAFASFERTDLRATTIRSSGIGVSLRLDRPVAGVDNAARFSVRERTTGSGGRGGLVLRTSTRFNHVRQMTMKIRGNTPTRRPVRVALYARTTFGGTTVRIGAATLQHGRTTHLTFTMPSAARVWRNEVLVTVSRDALRAISPGSLRYRYAKIAVYRIGMTV